MSMIRASPERVAAVTSPERPRQIPPPRRLSPRLVVGILTVAVILGAGAGYLAFNLRGDETARGRTADAARWQAMADAFVDERKALTRGRAAEVARWQAMADTFVGEREALARGRAGEVARWRAMADFHLPAAANTEPPLTRGQKADLARWEGIAGSYGAQR